MPTVKVPYHTGIYLGRAIGRNAKIWVEYVNADLIASGYEQKQKAGLKQLRRIKRKKEKKYNPGRETELHCNFSYFETLLYGEYACYEFLDDYYLDD